MTLITEHYRELNVDLHERVGGYGSGGYKWAPRIVTYARRYNVRSLLDYGCGKGTLKKKLLDYGSTLDIREYDPAIAGKDSPPSSADMVVCTDVLEHVELECLDDVLKDIVRLGTKVVLLSACCKEGKRTMKDGSPDHILVRPHMWWVEKVRSYGKFTVVPSLRAHDISLLSVKK